jgi:uncharacterized protein (TIGR03435 family)
LAESHQRTIPHKDIRVNFRFPIAALLICTTAVAQSPAAPKPAKPLAFEVVSIRPSKPGSPWGNAEILPDGYRVHGGGFWQTLRMAYIPLKLQSPDRILGEPSWAKDQYDIDAKVAPADIAEWQRQGPQNKMLQAMLQQMLAERSKLAVHRTPAEIPGYALLVGKNGPKLKETPPGEIFPPGWPRDADGGVVVGYKRGEKAQTTYYGVSMASFASHLSGLSFQHPVLDRTGLTGKYDFVLEYRSMNSDGDERGAFVTPNDPDPLANWNVQALGLKLQLIKIPTETIVIDHIEKPSAN